MSGRESPSLPPDQLSLKQRVLGAGGWSIAGYGFGQAVRLGSNLIMTRLLVPDMFGVMAIATMVTVILSLLSDIGLRQNIVQSRRGDDPVFLDTAWVVQIIRGLLLWLAALLLSTALALANDRGMFPANSVYASPVLPVVIAVSSLSALISGFQSTKVATAYRSFQQKRLMLIELISQLAGLAVMMVIGMTAPSIWALVSGGLVVSLTTTALSHIWLNGHRDQFHYEKNALRELIGFGKWVFVSSAVYVFAANGDRLLLGGWVKVDVLGYYAIAVLIVGAIEGGMNSLLMRVSLPALSEIVRSDSIKLRQAYYSLRFPGDLLLLFLMGLLLAASQLVIDLLYDSRYSTVGGMLQVLSLSLFSIRYGVAHQIYLALGIPRYLAVINVVRFVSFFTVVPTLYYLEGLHGAIWGIALHTLATVPFVFGFNARLGLNDFRAELLVLVALPIGYMCGFALNLARG